MPVFLITFVEGLLGPKLAKYAKSLIWVVLVIVLVLGFGVAKCAYDRHVEKNYVNKIQERAAPATNQAATERANDTYNNAKKEQERHDAVHSVPDAVPAGPSHALACKRLHDLGRHPPACS